MRELWLRATSAGPFVLSSARPYASISIPRTLPPAALVGRSAQASVSGFNASIPVEPTLYDLLVSMPDGIKRVQVKTTIYNGRDGWMVRVGRRPYSVGNRDRMLPYDPDALDFYFILDGDLTMYLIPSKVLAGRVQILLRNHSHY